jgi:hypothetical protein
MNDCRSKIEARLFEWEQVVHGLGHVCIEFQMLETMFRVAISELATKDDRILGSLITAELPFKALPKLLYGIVEYEMEGSNRPQELKKILKRCDAAANKRNQLVHSDWYEPTKAKGVTRVKFSARSGLRVQHETVTPADMDKIAEELRGCRKELGLFLRPLLTTQTA